MQPLFTYLKMSKSSSEEENDHLPTNNEKKDESDAWLASETTWTKLKYNDTGAGWREEYRCNKVPYRNIQSRAVISSLHNYPTLYFTSFRHFNNSSCCTVDQEMAKSGKNDKNEVKKNFL